jgi:hypothetical protein
LQALQNVRVNKLVQSDFAKSMLTRAAKWHAWEVDKLDGLSSYEIAKWAKKEYNGCGLHSAMIHHYVNAKLAGTLPLKVGVKGEVSASSFKLLCMAFEIYSWIFQINSQEGKITFKMLAARINSFMYHNYKQDMLQWVLLVMAKDINALTLPMHITKDRIVCWTMLRNISSWFDKREWDLVELGFATRWADGKVTISDEQLYMIINFDKMCLSLDGTEGRRGSQPKIMLHDPHMKYNGKWTDKNSIMVTLVCGSNAASKALPPHFQFQTKAAPEEGQRLQNEVFLYCSWGLGKFGTTDETSWDCTFGLNTKGGMDDNEVCNKFNSTHVWQAWQKTSPEVWQWSKVVANQTAHQVTVPWHVSLPLCTKHYGSSAGD